MGMDCFHNIEKQYKFYLAFENSFCADYITEKMYRTLNLNLVPIALNGANTSKLLPLHSYIDVRDFHSPRHLADYLNELNSNDTKYMEYFSWKKSYIHKSYKHPFCSLCEMLHTDNQSYKNSFEPDKYWDPAKHCKTGDDENHLIGLS
jgi:hypothetical protein